ncbi:hypothetical protein ACI79D_11785 [Geodermatophilus sp. SYSU D00708]
MPMPDAAVDAPRPTVRRAGSGRERLAVPALAGVLAALCFLVVHRSLIDDTYITLSYARNLAEDLHWGLLPSRTANSATSPLNVLVLGLATVVVRDAVWALGVVFVVLNALQAAGLLRLARRLDLPWATAPVAHALLLFSPLTLSAVGMEMTLGVTLLVWTVVAALEHRAVAFGVLTAALTLTRMDLLVFPLLLWLTDRHLRRRTLPVVLTAVVAAAPWYLFSWLALGALVPDTLVIKTSSSYSWGPWTFLNGPELYLGPFPAAVLLSAAPVAVGLVALLAWPLPAVRRWAGRPGLGRVVVLGAGGVAHYVAYSLLAPPPYHWYYAPSVGALTVVAAVAGGVVAARATAARRWLPALLPGAAAALLVATEVAFLLQRGLPWTTVPITTNWATPAQYEGIGRDLATRVDDQVIRSPGEIGTIAYYCRCDVVDPFSDRGTLLPQIDQREAEAGSLMRTLLELNFTNLDRSVPAARPELALGWIAGLDADGDWPSTSAWMGPGAFVLYTP